MSQESNRVWESDLDTQILLACREELCRRNPGLLIRVWSGDSLRRSRLGDTKTMIVSTVDRDMCDIFWYKDHFLVIPRNDSSFHCFTPAELETLYNLVLSLAADCG